MPLRPTPPPSVRATERVRSRRRARRTRRTPWSRFCARRDLGSLYHEHLADPREERGFSRATSAMYGAGAALTLDEFALWLDLEDVPWAREGRHHPDGALRRVLVR